MNDLCQSLSTEAQSAVVRARDEAVRAGADYFSSEHLLLGVITSDESSAAKKMLVDLCGELHSIGASILSSIEKEHIERGDTALVWTPHLVRILTAAAQLAVELGSSVVRTDHIILAILRDGTGAAAELLEKMNVTFTAALRWTKTQGNRIEESKPELFIPIQRITPMAGDAFGIASNLATQSATSVSTLHLLAALSALPESRAGRALRARGMTLESILNDNDQVAGDEVETWTSEPLRHTELGKAVEIQFDELDAVLEVLTEMLPENVEIAFNHDYNVAWVSASPEVDLNYYIEIARKRRQQT